MNITNFYILMNVYFSIFNLVINQIDVQVQQVD